VGRERKTETGLKQRVVLIGNRYNFTAEDKKDMSEELEYFLAGRNPLTTR